MIITHHQNNSKYYISAALFIIIFLSEQIPILTASFTTVKFISYNVRKSSARLVLFAVL